MEQTTVTFFPSSWTTASKQVVDFGQKLKDALGELGVTIVPYKESLSAFPRSKWLQWYALALAQEVGNIATKIIGRKRNENTRGFTLLRQMRKGLRVRSGVSIIALGESSPGNLPMDHTMSFRRSLVVTIVDKPAHVKSETQFLEHFDTAMHLFAHHMTNVVIAVGQNDWLLYNFNASHPSFPLGHKDFNNHVLHGLIPKLAAPIEPPRLREFLLRQEAFNPNDDQHKHLVADLVKSGPIIEKAKIYPPGKSIDVLPFRNEFYKWIGRIHLDNRSGMSYGFMARQMPTKIPRVLTAKAFKKSGLLITPGEDIAQSKTGQYFVIIESPKGHLACPVPDVWVLSQRSGSNKTSFDPVKDLVKIGLINGRMQLQTPLGTLLRADYRPSYDTKVILAHAVGNAIVAGVLRHFDKEAEFSKSLEKVGIGIAHWHGYLNKQFVPQGWHVHGAQNPHVSCSTPQSAIYALEGKIYSALNAIKENLPYLGDIQIEPQHGTNVNYFSLESFAELIANNSQMTELGNKYLGHHITS